MKKTTKIIIGISIVTALIFIWKMNPADTVSGQIVKQKSVNEIQLEEDIILKDAEIQKLKNDILTKKKTEINLEDYGITVESLIDLKIDGQTYSLDNCLVINERVK